MSRKLHVVFGVLAVLVVFVLGCLAGGCGDNKPPNTDTKPKKEAGPDLPATDTVPWPDVQSPDKYKWPDQKPPGDKWPWPGTDQYVPTPFGCQADTDCFGQKCCATPWGVKLCAPTCDLK